jgi:Domain of unknown function (DUF5666)
MPRPTIHRWLQILVLATISACSGGSSGRPPTIIAGNVASAGPGATAEIRAGSALASLGRSALAWWRSDALAQVPGVTIAIVDTSTSTTTDPQGFFRLEGNHFGPSVIRFAGGGADAPLALTLPAGGEVDLIDVVLSGSRITVGEQRIHFDGPVTGVDCAGSLLQVLSGEQVAFRVRLSSSTSIVEQGGAPLRCVDILPGSAADVQGTVDSNGDVRALSIRLNPAPAAAPTPRTFSGSVAALQCPASITLGQSQGNIQVNIGSDTEIREANGSALQCSDLAPGDTVDVDGTQNSFGISASRIERTSAQPTPTPSPTP